MAVFAKKPGRYMADALGVEPAKNIVKDNDPVSRVDGPSERLVENCQMTGYKREEKWRRVGRLGRRTTRCRCPPLKPVPLLPTLYKSPSGMLLTSSASEHSHSTLSNHFWS